MSDQTAEPAPAATAPSSQPQKAPAATTNGDAKTTKPAENVPNKLSPAELKKQKQAEKQARRAQQKGPGGPPKEQGAPKDGQKQSKEPRQGAKNEQARPIPIRRRPSQSNVPAQKEPEKKSKKESRQAGVAAVNERSRERRSSRSLVFGTAVQQLRDLW
jgi:translation initiation factor eIF-2B subunit delta